MNPHALTTLIALEEAKVAIIRQEAHVLAELKKIPIQKAIEEIVAEIEFALHRSGLCIN